MNIKHTRYQKKAFVVDRLNDTTADAEVAAKANQISVINVFDSSDQSSNRHGSIAWFIIHNKNKNSAEAACEAFCKAEHEKKAAREALCKAEDEEKAARTTYKIFCEAEDEKEATRTAYKTLKIEPSVAQSIEVADQSYALTSIFSRAYAYLAGSKEKRCADTQKTVDQRLNKDYLDWILAAEVSHHAAQNWLLAAGYACEAAKTTLKFVYKLIETKDYNQKAAAKADAVTAAIRADNMMSYNNIVAEIAHDKFAQVKTLSLSLRYL